MADGPALERVVAARLAWRPVALSELSDVNLDWAAVLEVARRRCSGKVVSSLEGGYDLEGLGRSAVAHVKALGEE